MLRMPNELSKGWRRTEIFVQSPETLLSGSEFIRNSSLYAFLGR